MDEADEAELNKCKSLADVAAQAIDLMPPVIQKFADLLGGKEMAAMVAACGKLHVDLYNALKWGGIPDSQILSVMDIAFRSVAQAQANRKK